MMMRFACVACWLAPMLLGCTNTGVAGIAAITDAARTPDASLDDGGSDGCSEGECEDSDTCAPWGECEPFCDSALECEDEELCSLDAHVCVECLSDADCTDGPGGCDTERFECLECSTDADCEAGEPYCIEGHCEN